MDFWTLINEPADATDGDGTAVVRAGLWISIDLTFFYIKWRVR